MAKPLKKSASKRDRPHAGAAPKQVAKVKAPEAKAGAKNGAKPERAAPPVSKVSKAQAELMGKILHMVSEDMAIEEAELTPNASLREDLGLDDIDLAELLMQAEGEFNVHPFGEADWDRLQTVDDFVELVVKRVEAKRGKSDGKKTAKK